MMGWNSRTATRNRCAHVFISGLAVLAAGVLVYALERPADSVLFLPAALSLHDGGAVLPPVVGGPLPTFLHVLAFTLMTAALLGPGARNAGLAAACWAAVNILFEFSQHPLFAKTLGAGMAGTFDPLDALAALLGSTCAYLVLRATASRGGART